MPDSGTFVIRQAGDTVATERFTRTATSLQGTLALQNAKATSQRYEAVVAPDAIGAADRGGGAGGRRTAGGSKGRVVAARPGHLQGGQRGGGRRERQRDPDPRSSGPSAGRCPTSTFASPCWSRRSGAPGGRAGATRVPFFNLGGGQTVDGKVSAARQRLAHPGDRERGVPPAGGRDGPGARRVDPGAGRGGGARRRRGPAGSSPTPDLRASLVVTPAPPLHPPLTAPGRPRHDVERHRARRAGTPGRTPPGSASRTTISIQNSADSPPPRAGGSASAVRTPPPMRRDQQRGRQQPEERRRDQHQPAPAPGAPARRETSCRPPR